MSGTNALFQQEAIPGTDLSPNRLAPQPVHPAVQSVLDWIAGGRAQQQPIWPANNPVGTERAPLPGTQSLSMPRGSFDPVVGTWPTGKPQTQSEYEGVRNASLNLFGQTAMMAGSPAAEEGAGAAALGRRAVPMEPAPRPTPESGAPDVWAPKPYGVEPIYRRGNGPNERTWAITNASGAKAGAIDTTWNPDTGNLHIDNIDAVGGDPNTLGPAAIRQLRSALLDQHPGAKTLTGLRISGATYGGGVGAGRTAIQTIPQQ